MDRGENYVAQTVEDVDQVTGRALVVGVGGKEGRFSGDEAHIHGGGHIGGRADFEF